MRNRPALGVIAIGAASFACGPCCPAERKSACTDEPGDAGCGQELCLAACMGCCLNGECLAADAQSECACGGIASACGVCPGGTRCAVGWCETRNDICAFSASIVFPGRAEPLSFSVHQIVEGLASEVETCGADLMWGLFVGTGTRRYVGEGVHISFFLRVSEWPWGSPMPLSELEQRDGWFTVDRTTAEPWGPPRVVQWRTSATSSGTLTLTVEAAEPRPRPVAPLRRIGRERLVMELDGTLSLQAGDGGTGGSASDAIQIRLLGFFFAESVDL